MASRSGRRELKTAHKNSSVRTSLRYIFLPFAFLMNQSRSSITKDHEFLALCQRSTTLLMQSMQLTYQGMLAERRKATYARLRCRRSPVLVLLRCPKPTLTIKNISCKSKQTYALIRIGKITDSNWDTQGCQFCLGIVHLLCQFIRVYRLVK